MATTLHHIGRPNELAKLEWAIFSGDLLITEEARDLMPLDLSYGHPSTKYSLYTSLSVNNALKVVYGRNLIHYVTHYQTDHYATVRLNKVA